MTRIAIGLCLACTLSSSLWAVNSPTPLSKRTPSPTPVSQLGNETLLKFNQEDFALAYEVFLANSDQERAYQIASAAVKQVPNDSSWRRKLAKVADWTQRPEVAVVNWRWLFQQGDRSNETLGAVIRLSVLVDDPKVALQAWALWVQRNPVTQAQWEIIFSLFENDDEPIQGSYFFEAQFRERKLPILLEFAAQLAENAGADDRADLLYGHRLALAPFSIDLTLRAIMSLVRQDKLPQALALMKSKQSQVAQHDSEFWLLLGQLAWDLRDSQTALDAYSQFARTAKATSAEWTRLVFLLRQQHPTQAASAALQAYERFGSVDLLIQALDIYASLGDQKAQERVFSALKTGQRAQAEATLRFRLLRAQFYQRAKRSALAWLDLRKALDMAPDDRDVTLSVLWFLIDERRRDDLLEILQKNGARARADSAYWLAYAAGYQLLERPRQAVVWYEKEARRNASDPLTLLNFADSLERNRQNKRSVEVRRQAWALFKQGSSPWTGNENLTGNPYVLAMARLALQNQSGVTGQQWLRKRLAQARELNQDGQADPALDELVLSWAILKEQYPNAKSWMWLRYARKNQNAPPLWASSQVALQLGDSQSVSGLLLDKNAKALPIYNRYDSAYSLGNTAMALDIAARGMEKNPTDEALHDRFRQHAPNSANYIQLQAANNALDSLDQQVRETEGRLVLSPSLQLLLGWSSIQQSSTDLLLGELASSSDRLERIEIRSLHGQNETSLAVSRRGALNSLMGFRLRHNRALGNRLGLDAGLDYRSPSTLTLPLRLAGYEHSLSSGLSYGLGKRQYLRVSPRLTQYFTQFEDYLGSGRILDMEAGYRVRTEYPDWRFRAFAVHQNFSRDGAIGEASTVRFPQAIRAGINNASIDTAYFIPDNNTTWGACVNLGENVGGQSLQTTYSRAWRPFLDLCYRRNTLSGDGYTRMLGYAGSITGEDHLSVLWQNSDIAVPGSAASRSVVVRYRHYF